MDTTARLLQYRLQFLDYMAGERKTSSTWLTHQDTFLKRFYSFMAVNRIDDLNRVTKDLLMRFQLYLYSEHLLAEDTVRCYVITLRSFFNYLYLNNIILSNPAADLSLVPSPRPHINKRRRRYSWQELLTRIRKDHRRAGCTLQSLKQKMFGINLFIKFLRSQGVKTIYKVKPVHLEEYKRYLDTYYCDPGDHIFMKVLRLKQACRFLRFFYYKGCIDTDPSSNIDCSQYKKRLEKAYKPDSAQSDKKVKTRLDRLIDRYLSYRLSLGYNPKFKSTLTPLREFLTLRGIGDPGVVTKQNILEFQSWLSTRRYRNGRAYTQNTILNFLCGTAGFYRFLVKYDLVRSNPAMAIDLPREQDPLPRTVMTRREASILLNTPDTGTILGVRDRTIFEVFYSTGMRANELSHLKPEDIDLDQGLVQVIHSKGGPSFQRVVPIGTAACEWIRKYIVGVRPVLLERGEAPNPHLFLSKRGRRIKTEGLNQITKKYLFKTGLRKKFTTHSWRVTCGTLMLKNGADIRYVQEQLGHHSICSTQHYTRLLPKDLKKAHRKYHPRELEFREEKGVS